MHAITTSNAAVSYDAILQRLNRASVHKHFDAYADIAWDSPELAIDPDDPRWELPLSEPIGATEWYQSQPLITRTRLGLDIMAMRQKMGIEFENILSRGLLVFASSCPNGSNAYRYAYHELIEESQHSLMFQEFVNRSGAEPSGLPPVERWASRAIPPLGASFPELFFLFVLAGEVPIDSLQRSELRRSREMHPLLRRIMQIHVTEEARHVCFAQHYLRAHLPRLSRLKRMRLQLAAPFLTAKNTQLMLRTPSWLLERHRVPSAVAREIQRGPVARRLADEMLRPLLEIYGELGLITGATAPLWHALGYPSARPRLASGEPTALAP